MSDVTSSKKIKIAFYMTTILEHGGGFEKYLIETARAFSQFPDVQIDIITMDENTKKKITSMLNFYYLKKRKKAPAKKETTQSVLDRLGEAGYYNCNNFSQLRSRLSEYDVVYSKNEVLEAFILKFLVGYKNIPPVVFGCHTSIYYPHAWSIQAKLHNFLYGGGVYKFLAKEVQAFHVINSANETILRQLFPRKKIVKIYNPFNFDAYAKSVKHEVAYRQDPKKVDILWAGRLSAEKGVDDLVKLVDILNAKAIYSDNLSWTICGNGPELSKIEELGKKWKNVHYQGHIENDIMPTVYSRSSFLLNTSRLEGFPYSLLEAQSVGLASVAYDISGCNEIIDNGVNGLLASNFDEIEKQVEKYIHKRPDRQFIQTYIDDKFKSEELYSSLFGLITSTAKAGKL